jgi:hypothetical protein
MLLVAGVTVVASVTALACIQTPDCGRHFCCCCWFPVAGPSAIADFPGVTHGVIAVPFEHAVAASPAVTVYPAVDSILAVASAPADPGVPILAGGITYWIVGETYHTIGLWDYGYQTVIFFYYRTIRISNIILANSRNYRTIGYGIKASIYRTILYQPQK